jgi:hypothetical protein
MAMTTLLVEKRPASLQRVDQNHKRHNEIHIPEMLGIDGFVAVDPNTPAATCYLGLVNEASW